jgi:hypothetical protein
MKIKQGHCPKCDSDKIKPTGSDGQGASEYRYFQCTACGCIFYETWELTYAQTEIDEEA